MQGIAQKILANPAKYSIEQLTQGVQNGVIPAYVGIPLIQEKIKEQKEKEEKQKETDASEKYKAYITKKKPQLL